MQNQENITAEGKSSQRRTRDEIKNLISNWRWSKLSRSEFCRREGLSIQTFCYWLQRNEENGRIAALYYSLIQSAKLNGLNPRIYMHYLLTQIHALRKKIVNPVELLPHRINPDVLSQFAENEFKKAQSIYDYAKNSAIS